jgi:small-conductance mechanosensitive channel
MPLVLGGVTARHVEYANDPTHVRDLLHTTAAAHPDVLDLPKATALFL